MTVGAAALMVGALLALRAVPGDAHGAAALEINTPATATLSAERVSQAEPPPPATTMPPPAIPPEYLIVGDSLCELALPELLQAATDAGIADRFGTDCFGGRPPVDGVPIALGQQPAPKVLMFELGTNPGEELQSMNAYDQIVDELPETDIYFATGFRLMPPGIQAGVDTLNDHMSVLAAAHDNVRVCDLSLIHI